MPFCKHYRSCLSTESDMFLGDSQEETMNQILLATEHTKDKSSRFSLLFLHKTAGLCLGKNGVLGRCCLCCPWRGLSQPATLFWSPSLTPHTFTSPMGEVVWAVRAFLPEHFLPLGTYKTSLRSPLPQLIQWLRS